MNRDTGSNPLIEVRKLSYIYPQGPGRRQRKAIDNISLAVCPGDFVAISGPSGCGKSTLCRCLSGLIPYADEGTMEGEVLINGASTRNYRPCDIAPTLALTFQNPDDQLFSNSVGAELAFGPENLGLPADQIADRVARAVEDTGIERLAGRLIDELSGGEKQRVAIASSMTLLPGVLVLDEPTSGLDPSGSFALIETLRKLCSTRSRAVIVVEHRIERLYGIADRLIIMDRGKVAFDGRPDEVYENDLASLGICEPAAVTLRKRYGACKGPWKTIPAEPAMLRGERAISLKDVSLAYHRKSNLAIDRVSLDFYRGELAFIMGANGSGKTTLAKCMNGLLRPDTGSVQIDGQELSRISLAAAARKVGIVFQNPDHLLFAETVHDELAFGPRNTGTDAQEILRRVRSAAELLGLSPLLSESPFMLSGGEKQRVAIASVLTMDPLAIVLDEPTLGLDYGLKGALARALLSLKAAGKAVIVITHDVEFAAAHAERIVLMGEGRVLKDGRPREILTDQGLVKAASLHLPQAAEIGLSLGTGPVLSVDEIAREADE